MKNDSSEIVVDVAVPMEKSDYRVVVSAGVLDRLPDELRRCAPGATAAAVVSDDNVMAAHGRRICAALAASGFTVTPLSIAPGERSKNPEVLLDLVSRMIDAGLGRRDAVVAVGGGVVGDVGGLIAALFMRGIPVVQCPTSLLAQVDASVGGKVAVDLPAGKNLLGTFHFPRVVLIDPLVLTTLPERELACGLAEMLKHGALFAPDHFGDVENRSDELFEHDPEVSARLIAASVRMKAACVAADPFESAPDGGRMLLNLGHTVGHAIESVSQWSVLHGEAVGLGLRAAARLSEAAGIARGPGLERRVVGALERARLPTDLDAWLAGAHGDALVQAMAHDKKRREGVVTYIALADVGDPVVLRLEPAEILRLLRHKGGGR